MIDLTTKIHDKFTLEFKVGFNTHQEEHPMKYSDFVMNTWIFVPNSLDINAAKYSKDDFYRDLKSGVRLITPSYGLHELATDEELLPSSRSLPISTICTSPLTTRKTSSIPSECIVPFPKALSAMNVWQSHNSMTQRKGWQRAVNSYWTVVKY